ncbi:hypothetical protein BJV77DRAFT_104271 [Russula vinacea]|nr:hypothetical protein BJV77DRAFT_104271 [Russula vinacea]
MALEGDGAAKKGRKEGRHEGIKEGEGDGTPKKADVKRSDALFVTFYFTCPCAAAGEAELMRDLYW